MKYPVPTADTERNYRDKPKWVREQRFGWHRVDFMYQGEMNFDTFYRRYTETLLALDESVGRILDQLEKSGLSKNTIVVYLGGTDLSRSRRAGAVDVKFQRPLHGQQDERLHHH